MVVMIMSHMMSKEATSDASRRLRQLHWNENHLILDGRLLGRQKKLLTRSELYLKLMKPNLEIFITDVAN